MHRFQLSQFFRPYHALGSNDRDRLGAIISVFCAYVLSHAEPLVYVKLGVSGRHVEIGKVSTDDTSEDGPWIKWSTKVDVYEMATSEGTLDNVFRLHESVSGTRQNRVDALPAAFQVGTEPTESSLEHTCFTNAVQIVVGQNLTQGVHVQIQEVRFFADAVQVAPYQKQKLVGPVI